MPKSLLDATAKKAATTPADQQLLEMRRRAGAAHCIVAAAAGSAAIRPTGAAESAFSTSFPDHAAKTAAKKEEVLVDERVKRLNLAPDSALLLDTLVNDARKTARNEPVAFTVARVAEVLSMSFERASAAKADLLMRGLIHGEIDSMGAARGYRVTIK
jgi:hypothetical protein